MMPPAEPISEQGKALVQLLTDVAGVPVYRADSKYLDNTLRNHGAYVAPTFESITMRPQFVDYLVRLASLGKNATIDPNAQLSKNTARALWLYSHELGHLRKGMNEEASNIWAFNHFRDVGGRLGLTKDQARGLWRSLPASSRAWASAFNYAPNTQEAPPLGRISRG